MVAEPPQPPLRATVIPRMGNHAYIAATTPTAARYWSALRDPRRAQLKVLDGIVTSNRDSAVGRGHGFARMKGYRDFAGDVPLREYEDLRADVERVRRGEPGVLTAERVDFLEPTGGSSGPSKLIPYTKTLKRQISRAVGTWIRDLFVHRPEVRRGRSYWAVSPPVRVADETGAGVAIGAASDSDYLRGAAASIVDRTLVLPRGTSGIGDLDALRYVTLRSLLAAPDLALVSVWNPSFLTLLMEQLNERFDVLLRDLEQGTISTSNIEPSLRARLEPALPARPEIAGRLRRRFGTEPPENLGEMWPSLRTISCWTDGHAARAVGGLRRRFPNVEVQGKGLISTEGIVSIPLTAYPAPLPAVTSHFLEFVPEDGGAPLLVDELSEGDTYEVVLTTGGGLYRYQTKDLVVVCGHEGRTPMLRFVGRADGASDLCGEKLTPVFVEHALTAASRTSGVSPVFACLSPRHGEPPSYDLWVEVAGGVEARDECSQRYGAAVEDELRSAHHYNLCRSLGQLGPLRTRLVQEAARTFEKSATERGQRAGSVKPPALVSNLGLDQVFEEVPI